MSGRIHHGAYSLEAAPLKYKEEKKLDVAEMKMLRWMSGVTRRDRVRNEHIRGTAKVTEVSKKIQESRLRWFGHVKRREGEQHIGREVMEMELEGNRRKGKPKTRWKDCIRKDMKDKNINDITMVYNRNTWRKLIKNGDPE